MCIRLSLEWQGPFSLPTRETRLSFLPPAEPGIYVWTVGLAVGRRISYIGQAADLQRRMYEHVFWTLGGAYCLYSDDHLLHAEHPILEYEPEPKNLLRPYLDDFTHLGQLAFKNLTAYEMYWSILGGDAQLREAVESALITEAQKMNEPLQNTRVSRGSAKSKSMTISSPFPTGTHIQRAISEIEYGSTE